MSTATAKRGPRKAPARRSTSINLRITDATRDLIDSAAAALGKSRTEFMLESAREHAIGVLLDQRMFALDEKQFAAFAAALDRPPRPNQDLKKLLAAKSPWER